jgi:hypothetical protein
VICGAFILFRFSIVSDAISDQSRNIGHIRVPITKHLQSPSSAMPIKAVLALSHSGELVKVLRWELLHIDSNTYDYR